MKIPVIQGVIKRRILANYRVEPEVLARILPPPFRPKLVHGVGIAGICLIRLQGIRPKFWGGPFGLTSENAAHRIAVEWIEKGVNREGVYIPRRDTSSKVNALAGGRLFPILQHHAQFDVCEQNDQVHVQFASDDGQVHVVVEGRISSALPARSVFQSLQEASDFFAAGSLGYSVTAYPGRYDGLELRSLNWRVEPLAVERMESSFFADECLFPKGSWQFDCGLIMRGIQHEWHARETLCCPMTA